MYDEDIMCGWSLKESDLNIQCINCSVSLVPKLYIKIQVKNENEIIIKKLKIFNLTIVKIGL